MKFRSFAILFVFAVSFFFVAYNLPGTNDASIGQEKEVVKWSGPESAKFEDKKKQERFRQSMVKKLREFSVVLIHLFESGDDYDFERMGYLLERQGAVINEGNTPITGAANIEAFFKRNSNRELTFSSSAHMETGIIQKVMEGYEIDRYVIVNFVVKLIDKKNEEIVQNDDYPTRMFLFHRRICWPDA